MKRSLLRRTVHYSWLAGLCLLIGCEAPNEYSPPPAPQVSVTRPVRKDVQTYFTAIGQTRSVNRVELRARVSGYLDEIHFSDGELVEQGEVLFTIDQAPYQAAVESAEAALAKARANLQLAEQQLARTRPLVGRQAVSESELDQVVAERASAEADVKSATAALREAKLNLDYTEIEAPFAGRIGRRRVDLGNLVQPGETVLAILESVRPMHAYFTVSETELLRFLDMQSNGELTISEYDQIPVELAIGSEGDYAFHGHIDFREFGIDPETGTTERRAVFSNENSVLRPGLFVQVRIPVGPPAPRLLIPEKAIGTDQRGEYVLLVNEKNQVEYQKVNLGELRGEMRVILQGLESDDSIVVEGLQRAQPGAEVRPEEMVAESATQSTSPSYVAAEQ